MTPWQTRQAAEAMGERRKHEARMMMSQAWHTAGFHRAKRMPPFNRVVGDTERAPRSSDEIVRALKNRFGVAGDG